MHLNPDRSAVRYLPQAALLGLSPPTLFAGPAQQDQRNGQHDQREDDQRYPSRGPQWLLLASAPLSRGLGRCIHLSDDGPFVVRSTRTAPAKAWAASQSHLRRARPRRRRGWSPNFRAEMSTK